MNSRVCSPRGQRGCSRTLDLPSRGPRVPTHPLGNTTDGWTEMAPCPRALWPVLMGTRPGTLGGVLQAEMWFCTAWARSLASSRATGEARWALHF